MKLLNPTLAFVAAAFVLVSSASATPITFNLGTHINGYTPLSTDKNPWLTATFTDVVINGQKVVELVMTNNLSNATTGTSTGEFVADWLFNIDPTITTGVSYSYVSGYQANVQYGINNENGGNNVKAGNFDIDFTGATANASRFTGAMKSVYDFWGASLTASSFAFTSNDNYYSAADIQGILLGDGNTGSGSIGSLTYNDTTTATGGQNVPEPGSLVLIGLGLASLSVGIRRNKRKDTL